MDPDDPDDGVLCPPDRRRQLRDYLLTEITGQPRGFGALHGRVTRPLAIAAAAVVVVAVTAGVLGTRGGTGTASAAEVRAKLVESLQFGQSIRGEYSVRTRDPGPPPRGVRVRLDEPSSAGAYALGVRDRCRRQLLERHDPERRC